MNNDTFTNVISEAMAGSTECSILLCILLIVFVITGGSAVAMMITTDRMTADQTGTAAALMFVAILAVVFIVMPM